MAQTRTQTSHPNDESSGILPSPKHEKSSLLSSAIKTETIPENIRCMLLGPQSSGKTSIAMNLAHSLAHSTCRDRCSPPNTCRCCSVLYIVPKPKKNDFFPSLCRRRHPSCEATTYQEGWDEEALKRIHVKYIPASTDTLIPFLASIATLPQHLRPRNGIILEDLQDFVLKASSPEMDGVSIRELNTEETMHMTKIVAILAQVTNHICHCEQNSLALLTTVNIHSLPHHNASIFSNWIPFIITLKEIKDKDYFPWSLDLDQDEDEHTKKKVCYRMERDAVVWDLI